MSQNKGVVVKNTGKSYWVRTQNGATTECFIKGNFRIKGIKSTNPIAVGDIVDFDDNNLIYNIYERKNYVVRKPTNLSKQLHIIAANIDQSLLIVTLKEPETSTTFIDRFLATCEAYNVNAILVFNKIDLLNEEEKEYLDAIKFLYKSIGYKCVCISAIDKNDSNQIKSLLQNKTSLLSGNSGVGKSTIVNAVIEKNITRTANISAYHHKGMHTTTFSEMFQIDENTFIIDTPGIKGFGTVDFEKGQVGHYFKEIFEASKECRFDNCTHTHEPNCAVLQAIENQRISASRYQSYLSILEDSQKEKYR